MQPQTDNALIYGTENSKKGMIIIKTLRTKNKDLLTSPIRTLVRNGEKNADTVTIVTDRFYEDYDLSQFGFVMEGLTSGGTLSVQNLTFEATEKELHLFWKVTSDFTAVSGPLKLTLKALHSDSDTCIIFTGGEIEVTGKSNEECLPTEIGEQLLLQIEETIASFEGEITEIASEKVSQAIEEKLSGNPVTSDTVRTIVSLTQSEYDALETPSPETLYVVIDG